MRLGIKCIPNTFFERYGGLSFLLKCNYNTKNLDKDISLLYLKFLIIVGNHVGVMMIIKAI